jgi:hypothetical protein
MPDLSLWNGLIVLVFAFVAGFGWTCGAWLWGKIGK